ncbi:MAG TPA: hypothetical protein VGM92_06940 [Candidatus Kapabacteria bacterium]
MKYFAEIIRILERFRERRTETVDTDFRSQADNKEFLLYDGIRKGTFPNDFEAADALYQMPPTDTRYSSMKNRLKVRMLNSIYHLNLKRAGFSEAAQAGYTAHKGAMTVQVFLVLGAPRISKHVAERTFKLANKFEITDVKLSMATMLRHIAGNMAKNKDFEFWNDRIKEIQQLYHDELCSWEYYNRILIVFWKYAGNLERFSKQFLDYEAELHTMLHDKSTYTFRMNYYRVLVLSRQSANRHAEVIESAKEALQFLESYPKLLQKGRLGEFWLYQFMSYLGIQKFPEAEGAGNQTILYLNEGSNSWFSYTETNFYLLMNTLRFMQAKDQFEQVMNHTRFHSQQDILQERFENVYKYYLNFALKTLPEYKEKVQQVRLNFDLLIHNATESKRDKAGMNMALRYAQVVHLFDTHNYDRIDNLIEPIQNYRSRNIIAAQTEQSTIFFRLIKIMVRWSYDYKQCLKYGMKLHNELKTGTFENVNQDQEVQILPYAWLWDYMLERMKERSLGKK